MGFLDALRTTDPTTGELTPEARQRQLETSARTLQADVDRFREQNPLLNTAEQQRKAFETTDFVSRAQGLSGQGTTNDLISALINFDPNTLAPVQPKTPPTTSEQLFGTSDPNAPVVAAPPPPPRPDPPPVTPTPYVPPTRPEPRPTAPEPDPRQQVPRVGTTPFAGSGQTGFGVQGPFFPAPNVPGVVGAPILPRDQKGVPFSVDPDNPLFSLSPFINQFMNSLFPGLMQGTFVNPDPVQANLGNFFGNTIPNDLNSFLNQLSGFSSGTPFGDQLNTTLMQMLQGGVPQPGTDVTGLAQFLFDPAGAAAFSPILQGLQGAQGEVLSGNAGQGRGVDLAQGGILGGLNQLLGQSDPGANPLLNPQLAASISPILQGLQGAQGELLSGQPDFRAGPGAVGATGGILGQLNQRFADPLTSQYATAARERILAPQIEALRGQLNEQGGGVATPTSGLFQELVGRREADFANDLILNAQQAAQRAIDQGIGLQGQLAEQELARLGQSLEQQVRGITAGGDIQRQLAEQELARLQAGTGQQQQDITNFLANISNQLQATGQGLQREQFAGTFEQQNIANALAQLQAGNRFNLGQQDIMGSLLRTMLTGALQESGGGILGTLLGSGIMATPDLLEQIRKWGTPN